MQIDFIKCHGSGNDFPLVDGRRLALDDAQLAALARALADRAGPVGGDGLLVLTPALGMRMLNPDGSEAETCLNGLRCTARLAFEVSGETRATMPLKTSRALAERVAPLAPGVATIRTQVGPVSIDPRAVGLRIAARDVVDAMIPGLPSRRRFTAVAMPNPHLVSFVDQVDEGELIALGDWCEGGPDLIPARANVSFVEVRGGGLFVRTYERGVGLTDSCGSAMGASTLAACLTGRAAFGTDLRVYNRGGMVVASATEARVVTIAGNATFLWDGRIAFDPAAGTVGALEITRRRDDEAAAWDAAVAALADG